jgi:hypothetical protein
MARPNEKRVFFNIGQTSLGFISNSVFRVWIRLRL